MRMHVPAAEASILHQINNVIQNRLGPWLHLFHLAGDAKGHEGLHSTQATMRPKIQSATIPWLLLHPYQTSGWTNLNLRTMSSMPPWRCTSHTSQSVVIVQELHHAGLSEQKNSSAGARAAFRGAWSTRASLCQPEQSFPKLQQAALNLMHQTLIATKAEQ